MDYAILWADGNNLYSGELATKFSYNGRRKEFDRFRPNKNQDCMQFYVVEITDTELICRAAQPSVKLAEKYAGPNRIVVWHDGMENAWTAKDGAVYCKI